MKNIATIIKKEFARFFKDRRMVLSTLILPGLLIFLLYSLMGDGIGTIMGGDSDVTPTAYVYQLPAPVEQLLTASQAKLEVKAAAPEEFEQIKEKIKSQEDAILAVFPENFEELIQSYEPSQGLPAPNVEIYYNWADAESSSAYSTLAAVLDAYEMSMANKFDINRGQGGFDLATEQDIAGTIFSMLLPFLILIFLFSGCMGIAPESIAGEKERGTIATLLVTPMKRSELAIGKIVSLSVLAVLSALSSFIGTIASLPKLMGGGIDGVNASVYGFTDYLFILVIIVVTVLVIISLISIISAAAKSIKEATTLIMPLMILVMLIGILSMFGSGTTADALFLIPIYNSVMALKEIFSFQFSAVHVLITAVSNLVYTVGLVYLLTRMFKSEKIMFSK